SPGSVTGTFSPHDFRDCGRTDQRGELASIYSQQPPADRWDDHTYQLGERQMTYPSMAEFLAVCHGRSAVPLLAVRLLSGARRQCTALRTPGAHAAEPCVENPGQCRELARINRVLSTACHSC